MLYPGIFINAEVFGLVKVKAFYFFKQGTFFINGEYALC